MFSDAEAPLISVIMPVFNAMPYLREAVESILQQTEQRLVLIAVDDGSTDGSGDYLRSVPDPRLVVIRQENSGIVGALNRGLELVTTRYVARMDADDICDPNRLSLQLRFLENHEGYVLVGCNANHFGEKRTQRGWPIFMPQDHTGIIAAMLQRRSAIIHPTYLAYTSIVKEAGGYDPSSWPAEDYDLFFRVGRIGKLANLPTVLYSIRLHSNSITSTVIQEGQEKYEEVCKKYRAAYARENPALSRFNVPETLVKRLVRRCDQLAVYYYRRGLTKILYNHRLRGYFLLLISAVFSPSRAVEYLKRRLLRIGNQ